MEKAKGCLYVVATPIGNLDDMSIRAIDILKRVDLILAEDTRHSGKLLLHFGINKPMRSYHEHSKENITENIVGKLKEGKTVALISDAGTPLIADPGYHLVKRSHELDITVQPVPGPCAMIAGLCASGLPSDKFVFTGFLSAKPVAREKEIASMADTGHTWIFYETPHRIQHTLDMLAQKLEPERKVVIARELTKRYETISSGTATELYKRLTQEPASRKGEFVVMVEGRKKQTESEITRETKAIFKTLLKELPLKKASAITAQLTGIKKRVLYEYGLTLNEH